MARKLPWDKEAVASSRSTIKRDREHDSASKQRSERRKRQRSPPSSPEPGPERLGKRSVSPLVAATAIDQMKEGFDADDIWMMVEDELNEVAGQLTAHLHQAEYDRRVKAAKDAPPKALPVPASPMSKKTKRRLEQDLLRARQHGSLEDIGVGRKVNMSSVQVDDPWSGTALAPLISTSNREKVSLKGLDRFPSSTRAAQGFQRSGAKALSDIAAPMASRKVASAPINGETVRPSGQSTPIADRSSHTTESLMGARNHSLRPEKASIHVESAPDQKNASVRSSTVSNLPLKRPSSIKIATKSKKMKKEGAVQETNFAEMPMWQ